MSGTPSRDLQAGEDPAIAQHLQTRRRGPDPVALLQKDSRFAGPRHRRLGAYETNARASRRRPTPQDPGGQTGPAGEGVEQGRAGPPGQMIDGSLPGEHLAGRSHDDGGSARGVGAGLAYTMVRMLGSNGVPQAVIVFCFSTFSCLSMVPLMIIRYHEPINKYQLLMLLGAGLAAAGGQFSITGAYRYAPAKEISIYDYSQIIFTTIMGLLIFRELPDLYSFIGYAIIITASLIIFLKSKQEQ